MMTALRFMVLFVAYGISGCGGETLGGSQEGSPAVNASSPVEVFPKKSDTTSKVGSRSATTNPSSKKTDVQCAVPDPQSEEVQSLAARHPGHISDLKPVGQRRPAKFVGADAADTADKPLPKSPSGATLQTLTRQQIIDRDRVYARYSAALAAQAEELDALPIEEREARVTTLKRQIILEGK